MDIICMSNKQVADKYWTKRIGNGQRAENHRRVIRWLHFHNFEHAQISPTDTMDINVHVMDKTDMDRWAQHVQQITVYGILR